MSFAPHFRSSARRARARRTRVGSVAPILSALALATIATAAGGLAAQEIPTRLVVRVVANDAKIIGSGVGGAHVVIRHRETGAILAEGLQEGGTGDTGLIMGTRERHARVFDTEGAAAFRAEIPISGPTPVVVEARGPLAQPHAAQRGSITLLLLPGEHLDGEGIIVNLNGFTVEILAPGEAPFDATAGTDFEVRARVTMLCGCPTEPGGLWDSDHMELSAQWVRAGRVVGEAPLRFTGTTSEYHARLRAPAEAGPATLRVVAVDRGRANTGMAELLGRVR